MTSSYFLLIRKASKLVDRCFADSFGSSEPNYSELEVLAVLVNNPISHSQSSIAEETGLSRATTFDAVERLCSRKFLKFRRNSNDARVVDIYVTSKGRSAFATYEKKLIKIDKSLSGMLAKKQYGMLMRSLRNIAANETNE